MGKGTTSAREPADAVSVDELSRRYHAVLLRYFARRGIHEQDAQDLVQDVFARLARQDALEGVASVDGYLFTTASNIAMDFYRQRKIRLANPAIGFYEALQRTEEFSSDRVLEGKEELARIVAALNEMPERMRNIFILARLENLPRAEIASRLGISKSLVEKQIVQATACLAERRRLI